MPEPARYRVTEAVLKKVEAGSIWHLTFSSEGSTGKDQERIVLSLSPEDVDNLLFDRTYRRDEIESLREGTLEL